MISLESEKFDWELPNGKLLFEATSNMKLESSFGHSIRSNDFQLELNAN